MANRKNGPDHVPAVIGSGDSARLTRSAVSHFTGLSKNAAAGLLAGKPPKYVAAKLRKKFGDGGPEVTYETGHGLKFVAGAVSTISAADGRTICELLGRRPNGKAKPFIAEWRKGARTEARDAWGYAMLAKKTPPAKIMEQLEQIAPGEGWSVPKDWPNFLKAIQRYRRRKELPLLPDGRGFNRDFGAPAIHRDEHGAWVPFVLLAKWAGISEQHMSSLAPPPSCKLPARGRRKRWLAELGRPPRRKTVPTWRARGACKREVFVHAADAAVLLRLLDRPVAAELTAEPPAPAPPPPIEKSRRGAEKALTTAINLPANGDQLELWNRLKRGQGSGRSDRQIAREFSEQRGERILNTLQVARGRGLISDWR